MCASPRLIETKACSGRRAGRIRGAPLATTPGDPKYAGRRHRQSSSLTIESSASRAHFPFLEIRWRCQPSDNRRPTPSYPSTPDTANWRQIPCPLPWTVTDCPHTPEAPTFVQSGPVTPGSRCAVRDGHRRPVRRGSSSGSWPSCAFTTFGGSAVDVAGGDTTVCQADRLKGAFLPNPYEPPLGASAPALVGIPSRITRLSQWASVSPVAPASITARHSISCWDKTPTAFWYCCGNPCAGVCWLPAGKR